MTPEHVILLIGILTGLAGVVWAHFIAKAAGLNQTEDKCEKPVLCDACKREIDS